MIRPHIIVGLTGASLIALGAWMEVASPVELGSMIQVGLGPLELISAHRGLVVSAFGAVLLTFGLWRRPGRARRLRSR
jgi:hypothetical protein